MSLYVSMVMSKALPQFGQTALQISAVTHDELAAKNGVRRETITKRFGKCSKSKRRAKWNEEKRRHKQRKEQERAVAAGKQIHFSPVLPSLEPLAEIFKVSCAVNSPNRYEGPQGAAGGKSTKTAEMLAQRFGEKVFNKHAYVNGFKVIYAYLWHETLPDPLDCECVLGQLTLEKDQVCPRCHGKGWRIKQQKCPCIEKGKAKPRCIRCAGYGECIVGMPDIGRLIATYYLWMGIEDTVPQIIGGNGNIVRYHQPPGVFQQRQEKTCADLGIDEGTLRKYNQKLCKLLIIKITPGQKFDKDGKPIQEGSGEQIYSSEPDKVHWMPTRLLDHEICMEEYRRFRQAQQAMKDPTWTAIAERLHTELLREWMGKEHSLGAFWNELRRRYAHHGIPKQVREALIPFKGG